MSDDMISQEEIDALLNGGLAGGGDSAPAGDADSSPAEGAGSGSDGDSSQFDDVLSDMEKDALGEIGNISMGSAATTLSVLLGHKVSITTPTTSVATMSIIKEHYPMPYLVVEVGYTIGIDGNNVLAIQAQDAAIIADLMMGGDGTNPDSEINEISMSAVGESMNQMMGTVATSLSTMFNKKIDISPPIVNLIDLGSEDKMSEIVGQDDPIVRISFRMEVDGLIDSEIMQILPVHVAKEMVESLTGGGSEPEPEPAPAPAPAPAAAPPPPPPPAAASPPPAAAPPPPAAPPAGYGAPPPGYGAPPPGYGYGAPPMQPHVATNVPVSAAQFVPLSMEPVQVNEANIGLILDVPLQVTVELGRTKKSIKEILELTNGSIVELDKLAGEPVEIQVNGKYLAKGEVVVIDENFGVRITDIASPAERAAKLQ
ncbi:MAG: flagellar motor switch phosphatase FliY [Selenomonadaceae bacterium]|nr:flagellar motor switch phosphatase FliY [Selenomonadaceae bacterium]